MANTSNHFIHIHWHIIDDLFTRAMKILWHKCQCMQMTGRPNKQISKSNSLKITFNKINVLIKFATQKKNEEKCLTKGGNNHPFYDGS